jgi:hypothetical protein
VEEKIKLISKLCKHFSMARIRKGRGRGKGRGKKRINLMALMRALSLSKRRGGMKRGAKSMRMRKQKGGALGAGLALGMLAPMLLGTVGKILKINV